MTTAYVGIDPGLTGAVAILSAQGEVLAIYDTPTVVVVKDGGRRRTEPDVPGMADVLRKLAEANDIRRVALEKVQPMPKKVRHGLKTAQDAEGKDEGWGALPNFYLGLGMGLWWGICVALRLPLERPAPMTWRSRILAGLPGGKETGRVRAMEMWPSWAHELKLKKHHGRADALLMAEWARRVG